MFGNFTIQLPEYAIPPPPSSCSRHKISCLQHKLHIESRNFVQHYTVNMKLQQVVYKYALCAELHTVDLINCQCDISFSGCVISHFVLIFNFLNFK